MEPKRDIQSFKKEEEEIFRPCLLVKFFAKCEQ